MFTKTGERKEICIALLYWYTCMLQITFISLSNQVILFLKRFLGHLSHSGDLMLCVGIPSSVAHCTLTFSFQKPLSHSLPNFVCSICRVLLISWLPSQGEFIWGKKCKIDAFLKKSSSILWACFRQIRYILEVSVESLILSWPWRPMGLLSV